MGQSLSTFEREKAMKYRVEIWLTAERATMKPKVVYESSDWHEAKEQFNFWANEYRESMDRASIRILHQ
jgi:hypothetical protein